MDKGSVTVAVTGASGYVAGEVISQLLKEGYKVKGSVRDINNKEKVGHLKHTFPNLQLFEADLLTPGSFDPHFKGCDYVMHTASPYQIVVDNPQKDLIDPALLGTLNVMEAADKAGTVKRVVITSSIAAIGSDAAIPGKVYTEDDWNMESTIEDEPYCLSKRLAEQAAWKFIEDSPSEMELVSINPGFILGPTHSSRVDSLSVSAIVNTLNGTFLAEGSPPTCFGCVDVRDVARAHILGMELAQAAGQRFLLSSERGIPTLEWADIFRSSKEFKDYPLPTKYSGPLPVIAKYSSDKAKAVLSLRLTPLETTLLDMASCLVSFGLVTPPKNAKAKL